jgi:two-component system chemotaxis response regulator CheB
MPGHDIVVVGASAGGVEALSNLVRDLHEDLPAALFVVLHLPPHATSVLPAILSRKGQLPAAHAIDGEPIRPGHIYVAPPNAHLLLVGDQVRLSHGPRENGHRPAIDPLFRSAARAFGPRVVGVVLSGTLDDGTAGLIAIKGYGGTTIVQDPADALYDGMPRSAIESANVDRVLPVWGIAAAIDVLARTPAPEQEADPVSDPINYEVDISELDPDAVHGDERPGEPSVFTCPDCHGTLFQLNEGDLVRFRCRVGHAYSAGNLLAAESEAVETALWTSLRTLLETAALRREVARRMRRRGNEMTADRMERDADIAERDAETLRRLLFVDATGDEIAPDELGGQSQTGT